MTTRPPMPPDRPTFGLLVVTHGGLAFELVQALRRIVGDTSRVRALSIDWEIDLGEARERVRGAIAKVDCGGGVLILTDMFGGTATNLTLPFLRDGIEIVTGVNLPMMIKFANLGSDTTLREAAALIRDQGRRAIALAGDYLVPPTGGGDPGA
jgi:PTS system mannose-specific IIA component